MSYVQKGSTVTAVVQRARLAALAGVQLKVVVDMERVTGVVRHVRGDAPTLEQCTEVRVYIDPDPGWTGKLTRPPGCVCPSGHVELRTEWIVEVA